MFKRMRYIHKQIPEGRKFHGFSVQLLPTDYPDMVDVKAVFCSRHDQFCKGIARRQLEQQASFHVPVANLPRVLYAMEVKCGGKVDHARFASNVWTWVWKYFL